MKRKNKGAKVSLFMVYEYEAMIINNLMPAAKEITVNLRHI